MKQLREIFSGEGEVRGYTFTQIKKNDRAYLYEVLCDETGIKHWEVFKHRENSRFGCISYPSSKAFGDWAWCFAVFEKALECFDGIVLQTKEN